MALSISVYLFSFLLCLVSVSVFGTIQRGLACPCASVDTLSRSVVKFHVAQFQRCDASLSLFPLKGLYLCILVISYGYVSLITDQLDWQRCRSPLLHCCGVVVGSLVSCNSCKQTSSILSSDRFTQTSQCSYSCRTRLALHPGRMMEVAGAPTLVVDCGMACLLPVVNVLRSLVIGYESPHPSMVSGLRPRAIRFAHQKLSVRTAARDTWY